MSVSVLYYKVSPEKISSVTDSEQIMAWISELPAEKQIKVRKLHQPLDQYLSLAGLRLLKRSIPDFSDKPFSLSDIHYPERGKPFIAGNIDFNISHSGDMVCCVISDRERVGIDIEYLRPVFPGTIKKILSNSEVYPAENNMQQFFSVWTQKEAIIKAANRGSVHNMTEIKLTADGGEYHNHFWYCYPIDIISADPEKEYTCHIACSDDISDIKIKQVHEL